MTYSVLFYFIENLIIHNLLSDQRALSIIKYMYLFIYSLLILYLNYCLMINEDLIFISKSLIHNLVYVSVLYNLFVELKSNLCGYAINCLIKEIKILFVNLSNFINLQIYW